MAKALDDDEFIFQLQLEEINKNVDQERENKFLCSQYQGYQPTEQLQDFRFCDTNEIEEKSDDENNNDVNSDRNVYVQDDITLMDIPQNLFNGHLPDYSNPHLSICESTSVELNPEILESPYLNEIDETNFEPLSFSRKEFSETVDDLRDLPTKSSVKQRSESRKVRMPLHPHVLHNESPTRCDSMLRAQFNLERDRETGDIERFVNKELSLQDRSKVTTSNSKKVRVHNGDSHIAEQMQLEMDTANAKELAQHGNVMVEQDRKLAEKLQLEEDLESAREMEKHNNTIRRGRQNGLFNAINPTNVRQRNVSLPFPHLFGVQESETQNIQPFHQRLTQAPAQQSRLISTANQETEGPVNNLFPITRYLRSTTPHDSTEAMRQPFSTFSRNRLSNYSRITNIPTNDPGQVFQRRRPTDHQTSTFMRHLLTARGSRFSRRSASDVPADDIDVDGLDYEELLDLEERMGEVKFHGLQQSEIAVLPKEIIQDLNNVLETQCVICYEDFQLNDVVRKLSCSHVYHTQCIDMWLQVKAECPICKENIKDE